jgi:hypothetical protein
MFAWPALYACMGILICLFAPGAGLRFIPKLHLPLFFGTLLLYRFPTWVRNIPSLQRLDRESYSAGNFDISPMSFFVQEGQALLVCVLLVVFSSLWAAFWPRWRAACRALIAQHRDDEFATAYADLFIYWQVCSLLLAGAFVPYTIFFWNEVIDFGDKRYILHAIIMHGLWGVSWILISLPVLWTQYVCSVEPALQPSPTVPLPSAEPAEASRDYSLRFGNWNVIASIIGSIFTFIFPLLKELIK